MYYRGVLQVAHEAQMEECSNCPTKGCDACDEGRSLHSYVKCDFPAIKKICNFFNKGIF